MSDSLNFHSHDAKAAILTLNTTQYLGFQAADSQLFTVGIHPWDMNGDQSALLEDFSKCLRGNNIVAIGEIGVDPLRGADIDLQYALMQHQAKCAEEVGLPVVFHIVRRFDLLINLHKELNPKQAWAVHGFRGKPEVVRQLAEWGIYMSLGSNFNSESAKAIPYHLLLVETDDRPLESIGEVVKAVAEARGCSIATIENICSKNLKNFYRL